jgi:hypothetical protein
LVELGSDETVARTAARAGPVSNVDFRVVEGKDRRDNPRKRMEASVGSALMHELRQRLSENLSRLTGGKVDLNARP